MTTLTLRNSEFADVHSALATSRTIIAEKQGAAGDPEEREFWRARLARFDALLERFDKALASDTSQDAGPEEEPDEGA